jgi:hypothetical protein
MINFIACILGALVVLVLFPDHSFLKLITEADATVIEALILFVVLPIAVAIYFYNKYNTIKLRKLNQSGKWEDFIALFKR